MQCLPDGQKSVSAVGVPVLGDGKRCSALLNFLLPMWPIVWSRSCHHFTPCSSAKIIDVGTEQIITRTFRYGFLLELQH